MASNMVNDLVLGKIYLITASLGYKAHTITVWHRVASANNIFQTGILKLVAFLNVAYLLHVIQQECRMSQVQGR